jgi:hypothetical protein
LGDSVIEFDRQVAKSNPYGDVYACEILDTLINDCLQNKHLALRHLDQFVEEVRYAEHMQGQVGVDIYPQHADAVAALGRYVYRYLQHVGLYDKNGSLAYHHDLDFAVYHNEVVLFRNPM